MSKKIKKQPREMNTEELAAHVFHPKILKAAKEHVARLNAKPIKK